MPVGNQLLDLRPGVVGQDADEEAIEPLAVRFRSDGELERFHDHAATRRRRDTFCGASGVVRESQISIAMASGASSSEMNCDVEMPKTTPRGSPRKISMM